jgi:hypothetical protein
VDPDLTDAQRRAFNDAQNTQVDLINADLCK